MADRTTADAAQNRYLRHNEKTRCTCTRCTEQRAASPRLAATMDGELETLRRAAQYRAGDYN